MADSRPGAIALGRQMTVEFYDCSEEILADSRRMEEIFLHAASVSGAHVVNSNFHSFEPQGVSGVLVISESHFAVHAWPEHDYAAVDLFTCGSGVDFDLAVQALAAGMRSGQWIISSIVNRGYCTIPGGWSVWFRWWKMERIAVCSSPGKSVLNTLRQEHYPVV